MCIVRVISKISTNSMHVIRGGKKKTHPNDPIYVYKSISLKYQKMDTIHSNTIYSNAVFLNRRAAAHWCAMRHL